MNKHTLEDYLEVDSLTPTADDMGEISDSDWWTATNDFFDDLIWMYYPDRTVFLNKRFPYEPDDPDNVTNTTNTINSIRKTFSIFLKSNDLKFRRMWDVINEDYDPLYNVDAHEFEDRALDQDGKVTDKHTGKDSNTKSGNQELEYLGSEAVTKTGSEDYDYTGTEANTRTGSEDLSHTGSDTTVISKTTFDDSNFYDTEQTENTPGATDTTTYNSVADTKTFTGRTDTHEYNSMADTKTFTGRKDKTTFNSVKDEQDFNSTLEKTRDLGEIEHIERRRYGNIGVTASQDLVNKELDLAEQRLDFFKYVVHSCVNMVTYAVD